jgi:hypothetical protein
VKPTHSEQYCLDILGSGINYAKVLVNTIMSLASERQAQSPVQLTQSDYFHYQYSSLNDVIAALCKHLPPIEGKVSGLFELSQTLSHINMPYYESFPKGENSSKGIYMLQTDVKALRKPHSPTLEGRKYVYTNNNTIQGNRAIIGGYYYSYVNLGYNPPVLQGGTRWSLPFSIYRLDIQEDEIHVAFVQISALMRDDKLPFKNAKLVINAADSAYSQARFIVPCAEFANLVNIIRIRFASAVWTPAQSDPQGARKIGATRSYEKAYYLHTDTQRLCFNPHTKQHEIKEQDSIFLKKEQEYLCFESTTTRGRKITIELWRWHDLLLRTQDGFSMKDKPFDLFAVRVTDTLSGKKLFKNELFAGIFGENRRQVSLFQAYETYRHRFDIEVHNRFSNQALLLDKFQSPNIEHIDNWAAIVLLTYWLLFIAAQEADAFCFPWERYDPKFKKQIVPLITDIKETKTEPIEQLTDIEPISKNLDSEQQSKPIITNPKPLMSVAQTRKAAHRLFSTFDLSPFYPKPRNNGKGRAKGQTQTKRTKHPVLKKSQVELKTRVNV